MVFPVIFRYDLTNLQVESLESFHHGWACFLGKTTRSLSSYGGGGGAGAGAATIIISSIGSDHARFNEGQFSVMPFASWDAFTLKENMRAGLPHFVFLEPAKLCFALGT